MIKSELVKILQEKFYGKITGRNVTKMTAGVFNFMCLALKNKERIEIRGFGSFKVVRTKAKRSHNPKTLEIIRAPARNKIVFRVTQETRLKLKGMSRWE